MYRNYLAYLKWVGPVRYPLGFRTIVRCFLVQPHCGQPYRIRSGRVLTAASRRTSGRHIQTDRPCIRTRQPRLGQRI